MRLFAAFALPAEQREHAVRALRPIRELDRRLRWSDPDQWHITLGFYGEAQLDAVADHLAVVLPSYSALQLRLKGAGSFARRNLWLGVGGDTAELRALMAACDPADDRRRAHLTVARAATPAPLLIDDHVRALSVYAGPAWQAHSVQLFQSELGKGRAGGPLHTQVAEFALGA
ncbi:RNA 2',3'-cyclic phosphodiesterase [Staphylococcus chromogenes]|nr:RNA 2',3'-cyclic phosphodiesterase [Staphylococcus chromogenes]